MAFGWAGASTEGLIAAFVVDGSPSGAVESSRASAPAPLAPWSCRWTSNLASFKKNMPHVRVNKWPVAINSVVKLINLYKRANRFSALHRVSFFVAKKNRITF